jgi:hypothetical protein
MQPEELMERMREGRIVRVVFSRSRDEALAAEEARA